MTDPKPLSSIKNAQTRKHLASLCAEHRTVHEEITDRTLVKKALMAEIAEIANREALTKVAGDGWLLTKTKGRKTLSKERLLEQGVEMVVIEKSTVEGKAYYQVLGRKSE